MIDDLGVKVSVARPVQRVVSLVPSITEAIAMTCPHVLVGCTDYCIRPTHLEEIVGHEVVRSINRVANCRAFVVPPRMRTSMSPSNQPVEQ